MELNWIKYQNGEWCQFLTLNLQDKHFDDMEGVYIIWQAQGPVVRVGQGVIRDRLTKHKDDAEIVAYNSLCVTWARVDKIDRDGVEKFLADTLSPKVGEAYPVCLPITVNLPWPWHY